MRTFCSYHHTLASINERADDQAKQYALLDARNRELESQDARSCMHFKEKDDHIVELRAAIKALKVRASSDD